MMLIDTRANAVVFRRSGVLNRAHTVVGTIPGVNITFVAAANGAGVGLLRSEADGVTMHWTAPGETVEGGPVVCASDGEYLIESPDSARWIRINVTAAFLLPVAASAQVNLFARYATKMILGDIGASFAASGIGMTHIGELVNNSTKRAFGARVWLDPVTAHVRIEDGIGGFYVPTNEDDAFVIGDVPAGGTSSTFQYQTIIPSSSPSDPDVAAIMHYSYTTW